MEELICISPIDGRTYTRRPLTSPAAIQQACDRAHVAQRAWARVPLAERCAILSRLVETMTRRNPEIVSELAWQMGRPVRYHGELRSLVERIEAMIAIAPDALATFAVPGGFAREVSRVPAGVVMVLAPWNYPYLTAANAIIPALAAGNAVLLKHSAQTLLVGERFAESLSDAGLPDGLFHNLFLSHEQSALLLASSLVDHATFTGSVTGGRAVERAAAGSFTTLTLELGGKDAAYVREDAELASTIADLIDGSFYNSGQSCCGIERIYVHKAVYDAFLDGFVAAAREYRLGNPLDPETTLGPVANAAQAERVRGQVDAATRAGARTHIERQLFPADDGASAYLMPQIVTEVDHGMAIMREESFGPVVGIMPVEDDDEALRLMNDSDYGLTASIWTADPDAVRSLAPRLEAGTVFANRCDYLDPLLAWTGAKNSGRGASLGRYGYDSVTRPRSLHMRSMP